MKRNADSYEDIIHLPRPISKKHPRMSMENRAAQFAPFAALTGYGAAVDETARLTDGRVELDEDYKEQLDAKLQYLQTHLDEHCVVDITYFQKDKKKEGGSYQNLRGVVKKIDSFARTLILESGERIHMEDIVTITGEFCGKLTGFDD